MEARNQETGRKSSVVAMPKRKPCWFMLDLDLVDRLESTKARTGLPVAEQIRRSIRYWLESREWTVGRKRPHARADIID